MAAHVDNWLVADSEDEDTFVQLPPLTRAAVAGDVTPTVSAIQSAVFTPNPPCTPPRPNQSPSTLADVSLFTPTSAEMDPVGDFTSVPSTTDAPSVVVPRPRPKPRVVIKKVAPSCLPADVPSTSFSHISDPPISATRTNDSIHPATETSLGFFDGIEDAYSSFGIAERAKLRSRKPQTSQKTASIHLPQSSEVIELTSDEDEITLKPTKRPKKRNPPPKPTGQTKPRPKPRLKVKAAVAPPSPGQTLTGENPALPTQGAPSSQLPTSTLPTIPPLTPLQARELTPLSSPPITTRKRKRIHPSIAEDEEEDEMDIIGGNSARVSSSSMVPPTFFAPSSSSLPTDSGIEIPPVESLSGRDKRKQTLSGKKGNQKTGQDKRKRGKKGEMIDATDKIAEDTARLTQDPPTPPTRHSPSFTKERHSPMIANLASSRKALGKQTATKKGKARAIDVNEEDDDLALPSSNAVRAPPLDVADEEEHHRSKENLRPSDLSPPQDALSKSTLTPRFQVRNSSIKPGLTPMSELIRRVNSQPSSPFPNTSRTYSPFLKSSRKMLLKIAPLHPNRRTPPPPPPRPPPPKKSKKQLEMEERIEEELAETVDGWSCLADDERKALRKARIDAELGCEE